MSVSWSVSTVLETVGALSIIRFRTAIKEPVEIVFLFWSLAVGIVVGAGLLPLAVIGSALIGVILLRTLGSEDSTLSCTAYDYGYYLQRNDGTYKFTGAPAEAITRTACADRGIPVASLPSTGIPLRRTAPDGRTRPKASWP